MKLGFYCTKCNEKASIDKEKSKKNFTVYKTKCEKCGGQTAPKITL